MCNEMKVAGDVWHNMEESIVILYDQSAALITWHWCITHILDKA